MAKTRAVGVRGLIALPLVCGVLAADLVKAASVRVPCSGRIWDIVPVYGVSAGSTPVTGMVNTIKKGSTVIVTAHAQIASSADTTTAPTVIDTAAARNCVAGDLLQLDVDVTGGSTPTLAGYGYVVLFEPTA
jgi:hypothetical protein